MVYVDVFVAGVGKWYEFKCEETALIRDIIKEIYDVIRDFIKEKKQMEELYQFMNEAKQKIEIADSFKDKEDVRDAGGT